MATGHGHGQSHVVDCGEQICQRVGERVGEKRSAITASTHAKLLSAHNIPAPKQILISTNVFMNSCYTTNQELPFSSTGKVCLCYWACVELVNLCLCAAFTFKSLLKGKWAPEDVLCNNAVYANCTDVYSDLVPIMLQ